MLKLVDLAARPDFEAGVLVVSPARRLVRGPEGEIHLEPLIMQAFLLLLDARGQVVTRTELFDHCWGSAIVGDDSLNRTIAGVRRIAAEVAPGSFEVETIPRTGYRLVGELVRAADEPQPDGYRLSRRAAVAGGLAMVGVGGLAWAVDRFEDDRRFRELVERGEKAENASDPGIDSVGYLRRAVALRPDDAKAQGLLGYCLAIGGKGAGAASGAGATMEDAERATRRALSLDPEEPHARLALIVMQRPLLDLAATEDRLREILVTAPDNNFVMRHLWALLQSAGRSRDSLAMIERALAVAPLAAGNHYPMAQLLWITGRTAEADRIIGRALELWPTHRFVRYARFTILAFTDRARAALAMLEKTETAPQHFSPESIALWRISLAALDQRSQSAIAAAREANLAVTRRSPQLASQAVLALSALGEVDAAFEAANRLLVFRASAVPDADSPSGKLLAKSTAWQFTPWLFTPPVASMRADPRFGSLCEGIGLTEYWAKRRVRPDYQLART